MKTNLMAGTAALALPVGSGSIARLFAGYGPRPVMDPPDVPKTPVTPPVTPPAPVTPPKADDEDDEDDEDPSEGGKFTVEKLKEALKKQANKEKRYRLERNEARAKIAELELSIPQKIEAAKGELLTVADTRAINAEVRAVLRAEGFVDLDAMKLLDTSKLKLNDNGEVEGLDEFVTKAKTDKAYLFAPVNTSNPLRPPVPRAPTEKQAKDMTQAEYDAQLASLTRRR